MVEEFVKNIENASDLLVFLQCFLCGTRLNLYHRIPNFNKHEEEAFRNIVRKGENATNQNVLLFTPVQEKNAFFLKHTNCPR